MITVKHKGSFRNIESFFHYTLKRDYLEVLKTYAEMGVEALRAATPQNSGETADAWGYEIESGNGTTTVTFTNSNVKNGVNIAILLIYGHATRNGGYVQGNDFVTPALEPIFQDLANSMWKGVTEGHAG